MAEPVDSTPRPRFPWPKLLIFGVGAALIASLASWFGIKTLAGHKWDAMKSRLATLRVQSRTQSPLRPALYGSTVPGNAWEDYASILKQAEPLLSEADALLYYADGHPKDDPARARSFLSSHSDLIRALSLATHRESASFPESWEADADGGRRGGERLPSQLGHALATSREERLARCRVRPPAGFPAKRGLVGGSSSFCVWQIAVIDREPRAHFWMQ
jgi:hypothetical protein